ncbi:hypothetical protein [Dietzia lutea]|uniref:DUF320 domain-containing protein n=1 Tax=Dietzia lutea TaxID=546160 RepID=A0A2S1R6K2_9ACTN|nr:hypothetical protein [Dietzia lutea]AWH91902.1 hypothetical protein A6035_06710 [Dietzia lutea]
MSKSIAYVGALAAALLVASAGTAAAQSSDPADTGSIPGSAAADGENGTGAESGAGAEDGGTGQLGELGELLPGSVTGSLPGYASGPLGSAATFACNAGSAAGLAANAIGAPLQVPVGVICAVLNPAARSADALLAGDVDGSVSAVLGGVPLVGGSLADQLETSSATESVEGSVGEQPGSLTETSLSPAN